MSWIDKIQTELTIATGDGKSYTPNWVSTGKTLEYNIATFEFKDTEGTLVYRGLPKGRRYVLEFYFQGEDHLNVAEAFEKSAANPKPWILSHPFYGTLAVQPASLAIDHSALNVTKINAALIETITDTPPLVAVSAPDKIAADKAAVDAALCDAYTAGVPSPATSDLQAALSNVSGGYNSVIGSISDTLDVEAYMNQYNATMAAVARMDVATSNTISSIVTFASLPALLSSSVATRIAALGNLTTYLATAVPSLLTRSAKLLYQTNAGAAVSAMLVATVTGIGNAYRNQNSVQAVIQSVLAAYNTYIANLNTLQTATGGSPESFVPDALAITRLGTLVGYTVQALIDLAASSRQQRTITLAEDITIIELAARLYGLKQDDSTIVELITTNGIGLKELFLLRKGRKITYFV